MARAWQLQEAKNRLSELIDATKREAQVITRRGVEAAVVVSIEQYRKLVEKEGRLIDVLRAAPKVPGGLDVERSKDTGRPVDL
jgi:antitoxin Phd